MFWCWFLSLLFFIEGKPLTLQEFIQNVKRIAFKIHSNATKIPKIILNGGVKSFKNKNTRWMLFGIEVEISQCEVPRLRLVMKQDSEKLHHLVENPRITIYNSSFRSLDLQFGTEALIFDCIFDGRNKPLPTLITSTHSNLLIRNSIFGRFVNKNGPTILKGGHNSIVTIENTTFSENQGLNGAIWLQEGGSIQMTDTHAWSHRGPFDHQHCTNCSFLMLENGVIGSILNSSFHGNNACNGGVIRMSDSIELHISNSNFRKNGALLLGGVIFNEGKSALHIVNSTFESNHAYMGGVLFAWKNTIANINESIFKNNTAKAGGVLMATENSHLYLYNSPFERNSAMTSGGAVFTVASTIRIQHSIFAANAAYSGAGLFTVSNVPAELKCIFIKNIMTASTLLL